MIRRRCAVEKKMGLTTGKCADKYETTSENTVLENSIVRNDFLLVVCAAMENSILK